MTSEFGAWSIPEVHTQPQYYKLDRWEDINRRRFRLVKNPSGTSHPQATLRPGSAEGNIFDCILFKVFKPLTPKDVILRSGRASPFRGS